MKNPLRKIRNYLLRDILDRMNDLETGIRVLTSAPAFRLEEGTGFNGQSGRQRLFGDLVDRCGFSFLVETGTYLGNTTGYMAASTGLPVYSCERNPALFMLARFRLREMAQIFLSNMDSRDFLLELSAKQDLVESAGFFYLDAHWGKKVPLNEEISIIASRWKRYVIMIDDFEVPSDSGYGHGSYGTLRRIRIDRLRAAYDVGAYFPVAPSSGERPGATGCVVLARNDLFASTLDQISSLRKHG